MQRKRKSSELEPKSDDDDTDDSESRSRSESEKEQVVRKAGGESKKRKQASVSDSDSVLLKNIANFAHTINGELIPTAYAQLDTDLHEGGAAKKLRDEMYLRILSALNIPDARENPPSSSDDGIRKRLRLIKANLQTVDQVRALFTSYFPSCIALIAIEIFGSTHGRPFERASTICFWGLSLAMTQSIAISWSRLGCRQQHLEPARML